MSVWERVGVVFGACARVVLAAILISASAGKIMHPHDFLRVVYQYEICEQRYALLVAVVVPFVELVSGMFLVMGWHLGGAALTCCGLFAVFFAATTSAYLRHLKTDCGCFGLVGHLPLSGWTVLVDAFLLVISLFLLFYYMNLRRPNTTER